MSFSGAASPAASTTLVLALLLPVTVEADEHPYTTRALANSFHYDPTAPPPAPAEPKSAPSAPAGRPRKRVEDAGARIASEIPATAPAGSATLAANGTLVLPKMTVPGARPKTSSPLPLVHVRGAIKNVGKGHPFETPAGRRARLIDKYYTKSEQRIAKLLFNPLGGSAETAEAAEQLNHLAYLIDLAAAAGLETPEDQKDLRSSYYELLGPRP